MIEVEIGELVLRGFAIVDRYRLAEETACALAARLRAEAPLEEPRTVGEQIAQAVYEAVKDV
jgi:hypothetical protein